MVEALNILESAVEGGTASGGAQFIVVISDALMIQDIVSLDGPIAIVLLIPATVVPSSALEIQDIAMLALAVGFGSQVFRREPVHAGLE